MFRFATWSALALSASICAGCASQSYGTYVRDADAPGIDEPAMSTGLDKRDLERMFATLFQDFTRSRFYAERGFAAPRGSLAIAPMDNATTEHIDLQLDAVLAKMETQVIRDGAFQIVSRERQEQIIDEVLNQQAAPFDPRFAARYGALIGTEYLITGKVFDAAERTDDMRRVQYMAFMEVIEVDTGIKHWQGETDVTKAYVAGF